MHLYNVSHEVHPSPKPMPSLGCHLVILRSYIKDAVAYCKKHGLIKRLWPQTNWVYWLYAWASLIAINGQWKTYKQLILRMQKTSTFHSWFVHPCRNDKYSSKITRYFVEYSDKESTKKTRTEAEKTTSTGEAWDEFHVMRDIYSCMHACKQWSMSMGILQNHLQWPKIWISIADPKGNFYIMNRSHCAGWWWSSAFAWLGSAHRGATGRRRWPSPITCGWRGLSKKIPKPSKA